jgi:hypothetical protein
MIPIRPRRELALLEAGHAEAAALLERPDAELSSAREAVSFWRGSNCQVPGLQGAGR